MSWQWGKELDDDYISVLDLIRDIKPVLADFKQLDA